jgi:predicted TIM-barrel fold metal-dependent hydrolase
MKPVIDVHAHIFNALDLPLKGYLLSRNYEGLLKYTAPIMIPLVAKCLRRQIDPSLKNGFFNKAKCFLTVQLAYAIMGKQYCEWGNTLAQEVTKITDDLMDTFQNDGIDLYVPLMIDYEYWFKNSPDNLIKDQIEHMYLDVVLIHRGKIHPFVPFDPARELAFRHGMNNPDGNPEEHGSLQFVKDAIENKGFIGVKLYNAMGYKPYNNKSVEENRKRIALHKKKYIFPGEEYDEVLAELYEYCVENEVPVTTHCGMYGSESYNDASFDFGQAVFWRDVLSQERFKNLRLNLAHFGWNPKQGYHGDRTWVKDICEMLTEYDHLFTDVAYQEVVMDKHYPKFKSDYEELCRDYPVVKERLLFGIDWHVIIRQKNFQNFKEKFLQLLKSDDLFSETEIDDFLGRNALNFLGLLPGGKNRERLQQFYASHDITPPEWFQSTA